MSKTIAFVPVRGGSKSIPLKNIKPFCGKPLVYWVLKALEDTQGIDETVVATDSNEIKAVVEALGLSKVTLYNRKTENAQDASSTESVMLEYLKATRPNTDDLFVLVQATSPLISSEDLSRGLALYHKPGIDSVLSAVESKRFFWTQQGEPINYDYKARPRRQDFDGQFMENGAFYINSVGNVLTDENRLSGNIGVCKTPERTALEIDEPADWLMAESLMQQMLPKLSTADIKLVITDVDGVLTDAGMYYTEQGDELKKFNTRDGMGFQLLREAGLKTGIITSENTEMVARRGKKLKVDHLHQGIKQSKLECAEEICRQEGIDLSNMAYIGDDVNDLSLLQAVGFAACPSDAVLEIKEISGIRILKTAGGHGVFREFCQAILSGK